MASRSFRRFEQFEVAVLCYILDLGREAFLLGEISVLNGVPFRNSISLNLICNFFYRFVLNLIIP